MCLSVGQPGPLSVDSGNLSGIEGELIRSPLCDRHRIVPGERTRTAVSNRSKGQGRMRPCAVAKGRRRFLDATKRVLRPAWGPSGCASVRMNAKSRLYTALKLHESTAGAPQKYARRRAGAPYVLVSTSWALPGSLAVAGSPAGRDPCRA